MSGGFYSLEICIDVSNTSAKPSVKILRCGGYLPRACFYIMLYKCFSGPSAGKLLLETEEGSFREKIRAHDCIAPICDSLLLHLAQQLPDPLISNQRVLKKPIRNCRRVAVERSSGALGANTAEELQLLDPYPTRKACCNHGPKVVSGGQLGLVP